MFRPESVLEGPGWGKRVTGLFVAALGVGLILAGWYFFRLDVDKLDEVEELPASRFTPYFLAHRREFKVIAQIGLVISLIRLGAACFGVDWPGRWAAWPLVLALIGLAIIGSRITRRRTVDLNWQSVPYQMRSVLKGMVKTAGAAFSILILLFAWSQWSHHQASSRALQAGLIVLAFVWEALFLAYGDEG
jgi:hypothetical protein